MGTSSSSASSSASKSLSMDSLDSPCRDARTTRSHLISLARAINKFSIEFYQEFITSRSTATAVLSPISLALGLGTLLLGASGQTKDDVFKCLYLGEVYDTQLLPAFAALHWDVTRPSSTRDNILTLIARLFIKKGWELTERFEEICDSFDISFPVFTDFGSRTDLARAEMNRWVEQKTKGYVKEFLPVGVIDHDTSMIMTGVVCFQSQWYRQFDPKKTRKMVYTLPFKEKIEVDMMHQIGIFKMGHVPKIEADVIDIPLANGHMRMVVFLPEKCEGLDKIESKLSRSLFDTAYESLQEELVDLYFPKFRFELGVCVGDILQKLGLKSLFSTNKGGGLSRLCTQDGFSLSRAYHYVVFEVDENGGEDSSQSHSQNCRDSKPTRYFRVDHPFLFVVTDIRTRAILFFGRVVRPFA